MIEYAAEQIAGDADIPDFGDFFLTRHPKFKAFPPTGWSPASEVHEAIFETLTAYARAVNRIVRG